MKKYFAAIAATLSGLACFSQVFEVESMQRVRLPEGVRAEQAIPSPDGNTVAFRDFDGTLKLTDRMSGAVRTISANGSMMDLAFTGTGSVIYREASVDAFRRRYVAVKKYDISDGTSALVSAPSRNLQAVAVRKSDVATVDGGAVLYKKASAAADFPVVSIDRGLMYVHRGGVRTQVCPLGTEGMSYLWPSVSPDGRRLLFFAAGYGTYTCNLDGSGLRRLGYVWAPVWYDAGRVVGMVTEDDGHVTTSGYILGLKADGSESQRLTDESQIAVLPATGAGRISYTTTSGELFYINVR